MPDIPYPIESHTMKIMILIGIWFQSYFDILSYLSLMYYKEYIINWMNESILITITNVKDLRPGQDVFFMVFDVIFTIVHGLLIILLIIMNIQMVIVLPLYTMYVIIYLF